MTHVSPEAQRLRRAVVDCIEVAPVIVGCSGGPDSLALVASAAWAVPSVGHEVHVVIVDHGLQADSARVAHNAGDIVRHWGIDNVVIERVQVGTQGGPEAAARTARRAALAGVASQRGISQILLAHTREDQAETVLLRLARGSGARSIASMTPCDPPWHRPFLDVPRDVVHRVAREYLEPLGVEAWDDPHNHDPEFTRVRVREAMTLMEERLGPGFVPGLARSAHLLTDDADALEAWAQGAFDRWVHVTKGECGVDVEAIAGQPRAVRTRLIRLMHQAVLESEDSLDFDHVQHVEAMISTWKGQGPAQLPGAITARVEYGRLTFHRGSSGEMSAT